MNSRNNTATHLGVLLVAALLVVCFGVAMVIGYKDEESLLTSINVIEAFIFILLGLSLGFFAFNKRIVPFFIAFLVIILQVWRTILVIPLMRGLQEQLNRLSTVYSVAITPYIWISLFLLMLVGLALLIVSLNRQSQVTFWIAGILTGIVLALSIISLGAFLANIDTIFVGSKLVSLVFLDILALIIFSVGLTFHLAYYLKKNFSIWISVIVGIASMGATFSSWGAVNAREKQLLYNNEKRVAIALQADVQRGTTQFFNTFERFANRWDKPYEKIQIEEDIDRYIVDYPFINAIIITDREGKILLKKGDHDKAISISLLFQSPQENINVFTVIEQTDFLVLTPEGALLINRKEFANQERLFVISDFAGLLTYFTPNQVVRDYSYEVFLGDKRISIPMDGRNGFAKEYGITSLWNFLGLPLRVELWPDFRPEEPVGFEFASPGGFYYLIIGFIFSIALALCIYFMQLANLRRRQAEESVLEKNFFIANISHELRTPLHGIIGALSILDTMELGEKERKWIDGLKQESTLLHGLIAELIKLSEIELKRESLQIGEIDLPDMLEDIFNSFKKEAKKKDLQFSFDYSPTLPKRFLVDKLRLNHALKNIIANALKYTEKGSVSLSVWGVREKERRYALAFHIKDTGVGIEKSQIATIFEKYKRLDIRSGEGIGLGLGVALKLVESMGGWIEAQSQLGVGSEFIIHLQLEAIINGASSQAKLSI